MRFKGLTLAVVCLGVVTARAEVINGVTGQSVTSIPNASLVNSQITLNGSCGLTSPGALALGATATIQRQIVLNAQTGTSYTVLSSDCGKLVTLSNASAIAVTLPQATGSFTTGWSMFAQNLGAGTVTITPTTSTLNGVATLKLTTGQSALVVSDGTNYTATTIAGLDAKSNLTGNFTATPTNAVQRTLASRLGDAHPITDWGAKGDGTTDNCTALTNALGDAITGTFNLRVPGGIYLTSCALTLGSSSISVSLIGEGEDNSVIRATGSFPGATPLLTSAGHNTLIQGVQLDANNLAQTGIDLNAAFHFYVDRVQVTNPVLDGLKCEGSAAEIYITNSRFYLTSGNATPVSSAGIRFNGCTDARGEGNTSIGFEKGIVNTGNNNRFFSNHIWSAPFAAGTPNTGNGWVTIGIDDSSTNGATMIGNEIDTPQVDCIKSSGFNARIQANYCFNNATYGTDNSLVGILLTQSGPFATVDSNYFYGGDVSHRFANDISVTGNLNFWNNLTSQVVTTHPNAMSGRVVFGGGTATQSAVDNATAELSVVGSVAVTGDYAVSNPGNTSALLGMDWNSNIARLRIAGSGTGSANGFQIQTGSNRSILTIDDNGLMTIPGNGAGSGGFLTPLKVLASGMTTAGNHTQVLIGTDTANSGGNAASVMLTYAGAGSASNYASFGLGSIASPLNVFASGRVTVNTTTDNGSDALQVNGNVLGTLFKFADLTSVRSGSDGNVQLTNNGNGGFTCLQLGPIDTSHTALCQSGTTMQARLADNSADAPLSAASFNGQVNLGLKPQTSDWTNDASGTVTGSAVKIVASGTTTKISKTALTDTNNFYGCVQSGAGASGTAKVGTIGISQCLFDNLATTAGHYIIVSTATVGAISDGGATQPNGVQNLGRVNDDHGPCGSAPCGPYSVTLSTPDAVGAGGTGISATPSVTQTIQPTTDSTGVIFKQSNTTNTVDIVKAIDKSTNVLWNVNSSGIIINQLNRFDCPSNAVAITTCVSTAVTAGGGNVYVATPGTYQIATTMIVGTASAHVQLHLGPKVVLQCAMTNGTDCITVADASGIHGFAGISAGPLTGNGSNAVITLTSSAVVQNVIRNAQGDGSNQSAALDGFDVSGNSASTVYQALVHLRGLFSSTSLRNVSVNNCYSANSGSGICVLFDSPAGETTDGTPIVTATSVSGVVGQTTATVTVPAGVAGTANPGPDGHGVWVGDLVVVKNCSDTSYNSTFASPATVLSVTDNTHFKYTTTSTIASSTAPTGCQYSQKVALNITSVFHMDNIVISGTVSGARPLVIQAVQKNSMGDIWCHSCDIEGAGAGQAEIEINGNTGNVSMQEIGFYGLRMEGRGDVNAATIGMKIVDASNVNVFGMACGNEAGTAGQSCVDISQTGSNRTFNINIYGIVDQGWPIVVNNHIAGGRSINATNTGFNTTANVGSYHYAGTNWDGTNAGMDAGHAFDSSFTVLGSTSGTATLSAPAAAGTPTLTLPTTTGTLASVNGVNAATGGAVNLGSLQGPSSAVTGTAALATLYTYTIPANTMPALSCMDFYVLASHSTGSASVTYQLNAGGSAVSAANAATGDISFKAMLCNTGSTSGGTQLFSKDEALFGSTINGIATNTSQSIASTSPITVTFQFNVAATDQVTPKLFRATLVQ